MYLSDPRGVLDNMGRATITATTALAVAFALLLTGCSSSKTTDAWGINAVTVATDTAEPKPATPIF